MNFYVNQTIEIHKIQIGSLNNSSVLQIGTSGIIKPQSNLYNTGGFATAAPQLTQPTRPLVPLASTS